MDKIDLFICSKPLQYLNAQNIPLKPNGYKKTLLIVNYFFKAREFADNIRKLDNHWDDVVFCDSIALAYFYILTHRVANLYISYDNGTMIGLFYHLKHFNVYVLEEGAATYLDIIFRKNKLRQIIDRVLGVSQCWGHSSYLKGAYVYYPDLYKAIKNVVYDVMPFRINFIDTIKANYSLFLNISSAEDLSFLDIANSRILVYVTDWIIRDDIVKKMRHDMEKYDKVYIKPHPHIVSETIKVPKGIELLRTNLMMEFIFNKWIENNNSITIYHEGTSSIFYYNNYLKAVDMSDNKDSLYNQFISNHIIDNNNN